MALHLLNGVLVCVRAQLQCNDSVW